MRTTRIDKTLIPVLVTAIGLAATVPVAAQGTSSRRSTTTRRTTTYRPAQRTTGKVIPANTVVKVKLDQDLSTKEARPGDRFTATLDDDDYSGFPAGTRFEGTVTEATRPTKTRPGILDVTVRRALLPGGSAVAVSGQLAGLEEDDVRRVGRGRLESKHRGKGKFQTKWVGYGAAGGAVLSTIFGGNFLKGALLGGVGGAVYGYLNKDKGSRSYRDVELDRGTGFGLRLNQRVVFNDSSRYRYASYEDVPDRDYRNDGIR